jgi:hypothetical protein
VNPDLAAAIPELVASGALTSEQATPLLRVSRGELVGVRSELRALLYLGVLVALAGIGLLVKENLDRIGPFAIATAIGLAAAAALFWVARVAPPFSWQEVTSPKLAFDYILFLGVALVATDLAYIEVNFAPLGPFRAWHLLIVAVLAGLAAFRFDSRIVFSFALSTLAAWRGVSLARPDLDAWFASDTVRWNAIGCGVLFALFGVALSRLHRKAHFEPLAVHFGWLLILLGMATGMADSSASGNAWGLALVVVGAGLAVGAFRARRFSLFALGVVAGYVAACRLLLEVRLAQDLGCFWLGASSMMVIGGLLVAQRAMRKAT